MVGAIGSLVWFGLFFKVYFKNVMYAYLKKIINKEISKRKFNGLYLSQCYFFR